MATSSPWIQTSPGSELVTRIGQNGSFSDHADLAALIGGILSGVLLVFVCVITVLMWCLSRQKGSYVTNEDDDEDDEDQSAGSDMELQSKQPLNPKDQD